MIKDPLDGDVHSRRNSWADFASACCLSSTAWLLGSSGGCLQGIQDHLHHLLAQQASDTSDTQQVRGNIPRLSAVTAQHEAAVKTLIALAEAKAAGECLEYLVGKVLM